MNLTHYLYIPFNNNGNRYHRKVQDDADRQGDLEQIGAEYMLDCFEAQAICNRYLKDWIAPATRAEAKQTERDFRDAVDLFMSCSRDGVLLVHLDEHRDMSNNPAVRRGAMQLLTSLGNRVKVITTYTDLPPLAAACTTSKVCRVPIPQPTLDVSWLMKHRQEFAMPRP